jgi:toxin ParE1/3/4
VTHKVAFRPHAVADLERIYDFIARDSPANAFAYTGRIRKHCESLSEMPHRGRPRDDLGPGIRTLSFERRAVIAYQVDAPVVRILRIFYAGQDFDSDSFR